MPRAAGPSSNPDVCCELARRRAGGRRLWLFQLGGTGGWGRIRPRGSGRRSPHARPPSRTRANGRPRRRGGVCARGADHDRWPRPSTTPTEQRREGLVEATRDYYTTCSSCLTTDATWSAPTVTWGHAAPTPHPAPWPPMCGPRAAIPGCGSGSPWAGRSSSTSGEIGGGPEAALREPCYPGRAPRPRRGGKDAGARVDPDQRNNRWMKT